MDISFILEKAISLYESKVAVVSGPLRLTYGEFAARVYTLANALRKRGITKGDRVAILHNNSHEFLESYFAAAHIGAILNPLNFRLSAAELAYIIKDSEASILISAPQFLGLVESLGREKVPLRTVLITSQGTLEDLREHPQRVIPAQAEIHSFQSSMDSRLRGSDSGRNLFININAQAGSETKPHGFELVSYEEALAAESPEPPPAPTITDTDIAHLYYTSGTTGRPKGVMLTHKNVCVHALAAIAELGIRDTDVWIHVAPLFHLADAWATFAVTWVGGRHVTVPEFKPELVLEAMEKEKVTITNMIPTMLNMLVNTPGIENYDFSSLRVMLSGGAPIAPDVVKRIMDTFKCDYIQTYGMTETSPYLTLSILKENLLHLPDEQKFTFKAKTGRPFIGVLLKVVKEDGREVTPDGKEVGEIIVRGDIVTPGYWNNPEETAKAIRDGWLYTGDMAVLDSEGYVNIVDRKKDMIITGGENVYSVEVENVLYKHPAVLEAAVIGVPDPKWGEAVKAVVVLKKGHSATEEELINFCKDRMARYKAPKSIDFVNELPKTGSGKIYKKALKDRYWG